METLFGTEAVKRFDNVKVVEKPKFQFEFQELGVELEPIYGKAIWTLPYKSFATEFKIRKAHEIAKSRGIVKFAYLVGIIKKLP